MPLIESLLAGVGTGIAKGVAKLWLRDNLVAESVSDNLIDAIKERTPDPLARNSAIRLFGRIRDKAAETISRAIESDPSQISEERRVFIANAAGEAIRTTALSAELLASQNLDPERLKEYFLSKSGRDGGNPGIVDKAELELYKRILSEAAQCIVDVASQMPNFNTHTFAEVLKREDSLQKSLDQIFDEIRRIQQVSWDIDSADIRFESDYMRTVIRRLDELRLFGVDLPQAIKRYRLTVAYVSLAVRFAISASDSGLGSKISGPVKEESCAQAEDELEIVPVSNALKACCRLLVRGAAGSGKTTLLQWIAVKAASQVMPEALSDWNGNVPYLIRLREFSGKSLPAPTDFARTISSVLSDSAPDGWTRRRLQTGKAIVLVDGLDEIAAEERNGVREWIADLVALYPTAKFVVTSRPHAAPADWLSAHGFLEAELQGMSRSDVQAFISHWHSAVLEGAEAERDREELKELESHLWEELLRNPAIFRLVTSPLLCALICALHRDRFRNLPRDRIELYRLCVEMFLRRDVERRVSLRDYPEIGDREKRALLEDLALWLIRQERSEIDAALVDERFSRTIQSLHSIATSVTGTKVRHFFVERSGILREPTVGKLDFAHRTFQEYLAALGAISERSLNELVKNAHNDQWSEVVVLAAGIANPSDAEVIVKGIIERGDGEPEYRSQLYLLAVGCLENVLILAPESAIKDSVKNRLSLIVPPRSMSDAWSLSAAGDLVVPFLQFNNHRYATESACCIRTLAHIGTDTAFEAMKEYCRDSRRTVHKAIFDSLRIAGQPPEVSTEFLAHLFASRADTWFLDLSSLKLGAIPPEIRKLRSIRTLIFSANQIEVLPPEIGQLAELTSLYLNDNQLTAIPDSIGDLSKLNHLDLSANEIRSLPDTIGNLSRLNVLRASNNKLSSVPKTLTGLRDLLEFDIHSNQLRSLESAIYGLEKLQILRIDNTELSQISDDIAELSNLEQLWASRNELTTLPTTIGRLTKLCTLDCAQNQLSELPAEIGDLRELIGLDLSRNQLKSIPSQLGKLAKLRRLDLSENLLSCLPSELGQLTKLQTLVLASNKLSSLPEELAGLTSLLNLQLGNNELHSLSRAIGKLKDLRYLILAGNRLSALPSEICELVELSSLSIGRNQLRVLPPELGRLKNLAELRVDHNLLETVPVELCALKNLRLLNLEANQLLSLPREIATLGRLTILQIGGNKIAQLPDELSTNERIQVFGKPA